MIVCSSHDSYNTFHISYRLLVMPMGTAQ